MRSKRRGSRRSNVKRVSRRRNSRRRNSRTNTRRSSKRKGGTTTTSKGFPFPPDHNLSEEWKNRGDVIDVKSVNVTAYDPNNSNKCNISECLLDNYPTKVRISDRGCCPFWRGPCYSCASIGS